ncbi:MAG TPA: YggS family pyridoxal phosphate-dependent enzyme [Candidatus Deferrimicrobium sp.]|nr:YggS family pyridoxal phosphate-dependent enzyme [Candidatus Deferrimicrobium sp.]
MKDSFTRNLTQVRGRIAQVCEQHDRNADDITIVAVTKTYPAALIRAAVAAGIHDIGESRVQEAEPKITELGSIARFHMVGHLQTNKVKKAVELFDVLQSVDSYKLAWEINRQAAQVDRTIECFLEFNCSGESRKYGLPTDECLDLVRKIQGLENIRLSGLMTVGPLTRDEECIRRSFSLCREVYQRAREVVGDEFRHLSMGMSDDYELAIAEGATMIRVGTALFGSRTGRPQAQS